jgi:hypothetical protein
VRLSSIDDVEGGWSIEHTVALRRELKKLESTWSIARRGGIQGSATAATKTLVKTRPGLSAAVLGQSAQGKPVIATMAVGLILTAQQAEQALQEGRADLIAVGREALFDPNWPLHAAPRSAPIRNCAHGRSSTAGGSPARESLLARAWECADEVDPDVEEADGKAHRALRQAETAADPERVDPAASARRRLCAQAPFGHRPGGARRRSTPARPSSARRG